MATVRHWDNLSPNTALTYFEGINTSENSYTFEESDSSYSLVPNNIGISGTTASISFINARNNMNLEITYTLNTGNYQNLLVIYKNDEVYGTLYGTADYVALPMIYLFKGDSIKIEYMRRGTAAVTDENVEIDIIKLYLPPAHYIDGDIF